MDGIGGMEVLCFIKNSYLEKSLVAPKRGKTYRLAKMPLRPEIKIMPIMINIFLSGTKSFSPTQSKTGTP